MRRLRSRLAVSDIGSKAYTLVDRVLGLLLTDKGSIWMTLPHQTSRKFKMHLQLERVPTYLEGLMS